MKAKHFRLVETARLLVAAALLVGLALGLGPAPAHARDVPLPTEHTVVGNFDSARDAYAADLDNDGDLDIIGAAYYGLGYQNHLSWWENAGGGWTWHGVADFVGAMSVYAADLDGDGDLDILSASPNPDDIAWWENDGAGGGWTKTTVDGSFGGAWDVYAADLDGDGDLDILGAASVDDDIAWWENGSTPTNWAEHTVDGTFDGARSVHAADVDGDGDLDVLGAADTDDDITWWENTIGDGSAWTEHTVDGSFVYANSVYAADMDDDGDLDVLGSASAAGDITWWENTDGGGTSWTERTVDGSFSCASAAYAADVDNDGDLDMLGAAGCSNDRITWWENANGGATSWTEHTVDASYDGAHSVYAADLDGDGDLDVLGAASDADAITWWENETIHRNAAFPNPAGEHLLDGSFADAISVYAADLDGDGDLDVLGSGESYNQDVTWWENDGAGGGWTGHTLSASFDNVSSIYAADVDGDGHLDVLGADFDGITWWENDGTPGNGGWIKHTVDADFQAAMSVYAADVDGDGDMDVLGASANYGEITWWENDGAGGGWTEHSVDASGGVLELAVYAADLDGDGDLDVLGGDGNLITWWENTGDCTGAGGACTNWNEHELNELFHDAYSVYAADLDGDGDLDILGTAEYDDDIAWWENDGTPGNGGWTMHTIKGNFDGAHGVYAADVDGDGDLDILGAANVADDVTWWENDGTPGDGGWTEHVVDGSFNGAASVYAADLDDDGALDILGAAEDANDITWWENRGGQFALATTGTAPSQLNDGQTDDLLKIVMTHNGRSGDTDEELDTLELLFEETASDPLTTAEANAVIANLYIYRDDGDGDFDSGDTLVTTVDTLALTGGVQTVTLPDGDASVQVVYGTPRTYFVVVELAADAHTQTAIDQFRVTHLTGSSSTAQDRDHDIPLTLEYAADAASGDVMVPRTRIWDGEGSTQDWSEVANWTSDIAPRTFDGVRFDITSVENAAIDASFPGPVVDLIIASNYTGQITQNTDLTLSGDFSQNGGTFTGGSSTLEVGGAFTLSSGTFTAPSGLMSVGGGFAHSGGTFDPNGGRVVLDNTGDQTLSTTFNDLYLNDGLLGYWKLDDGSGATAADSSGYGYDGTLTDGPVWSTDTPSTMDFHDPYALSFDGSNDYVDIVGTPDIDDLQQFTLAAWVKLNSLPAGSAMRFITLRGEKAVLRYDNIGTAQLHFYVKINGSLYSIRVDNALSTGTWLHVAGTYDGGTMRLYLNGTEQPGAKSVSGTVDTGGGLHLSSPGGTLDGLLDDVRIYNRALSPTEIGDLADGKHPQTSTGTTTLGAALDVNGSLTLNSGTLAQSPLEGYWKLDDGSGTTASDSSANAYDGTLTNSPTWSTDTPTTNFSNPYALSFDRSDNDYVDAPNTSDIAGLQQFTLAAWVKLDTMPASTIMRFVTLGSNKACLRYDGVNGTGQLHFYAKIDGDYNNSIRVNNALSTGTWYHVAGTYDGEIMRLYLNGTQQGTHSVAGTVDTEDGVKLSWDGEALDGLLDDVRVYNRDLSAPEVQALANGDDVRAQDITIAGDFIRNGGVFEAGGGTVTFDGSGTQTLDTDTNGILFYGLTVNSGATLVVQRDYSANNGIVTNNGTLQQTKNIPSGSGKGFLGTGGYGGVDIYSSSGSADMGDTTVTIRGNQDCTTTAGETVKRCFDIAPSNTSSLQVSLQFYFAASELSGNECNALNVYHWNGSGWDSPLPLDTTWGGDGRVCPGEASEPYSVRVYPVSDFSPFALKGGGGPTAVTLVSFAATPVDGAIRIAWETASEVDILGFNLYRSRTAEGEYTRLAYIPAEGSLLGALYAWLDSDVQPGVSYYYKLEDLSPSGQGTFHGPVRATLAAWPAHVIYLPLVVR